ncbi:type II secretion system protein GspM [Paraglaciecola sp.]|uniref:type II secretion system protein GspM n=1 Tax=Paraglaciecola sp. TaxID=1920173 RepID=UPI0030F3AD65
MSSLSPLQREYSKLSKRFDVLSVREQQMISLCSVILVIFIGYFLLLDPQLVSNDKIRKTIERNHAEVSSLVEQTQALTLALQQDPNKPVKQRIVDIQQQISEVNLQLALQTSNLVPANKMPKMLENVLVNSKRLKVVSLESISPQAISLGQGKDKQDASKDAVLYRHGVKLVFEGEYFDVQHYLEKLESLDWQFYWKKFDYKVNEYPLATVELEIYTLSTNRAFIGV